MDDQTPDVFGIVDSTIAGAYEVVSVVAEGGFAVVYRAHHTGFSAPVALKCLKLPTRLPAERQAAFLAQFRAEAELLFQLSASIPTVVRPLHVDALTTKDGTFVPFMVLEWLEGETLDALIRRRRESGRSPLSLKKVVRLMTPVARALERAHNFRGPRGSVSIVHRDMKPENVFIAEVCGEQVVKVLDFGVAGAQSAASQAAGHGTSAGAGFFTPAYAAPEQWLPKRYGQTGPWTDVYGLALTLVETLKGAAVLSGDVQGMMSMALDKQRRPTPRNNGVEVSDAVEAVFARALALDPRERPADAGVFWDQLLVALGMKVEDRHRDLRSDAGDVPREERIEAALSPAIRHSGAPAAAAQRAPELRPSLRSEERLDFDLDSSSEIAVAPKVDPDSSTRVPVARIQLQPAQSRSRLRAVPKAEPVETPALVAGLDDPFSAPAPKSRRRAEHELDLDTAAPRLEIDVQAPDRNEPRRMQTGRQVPYVPPVTQPGLALWPRLGLGAGLVGAAIALALADRALEPSGGLPLGPLSPTLVAGVLILAGIGVIVHRLVQVSRQDH